MEITLTGFHAIEEAVRNAKTGCPEREFRLFYEKKTGPRVKKILTLASSKKLTTVQAKQKELDRLVQNLPELLKDHRGIVLVYEADEQKLSLEVFLASNSGRKVLTVALLCNILDPHNEGAILRSADQFDVDAIIVSKNRSAGDYATIAKISSGANQVVPRIQVKNLNRATEILKANGFWLYGADLDGESLHKVDFAKRSCLVLGNEGHGISKSLKDKMDEIITIPTNGKIDSLNVSNAAAVIFYQRYVNLKA